MVSVAMVSVTGAKRRTQKRRSSQKKRRLQHGTRRRSRIRKSAAKKRKNRPMKKRRSASKRSFRFNAKKLKGAKGSGRFLSREAKKLMLAFVEDIYKQVSSEAERLRKKSREAMVSPMHVQAALQTVVPKRRWKQVAFRNRRQKNAPSPQRRGFKALGC